MRKIIGFRTLCVGLGIWVGTVVVSAQGEFKALPWSQSTAYNSYLMRDVHRQFASRQSAIQQAFTSPAGMQEYLEGCRERYKQIVGTFPEKENLNVQVVGKIQGTGYHIEKIIFESKPGRYVTGGAVISAPSRSRQTPILPPAPAVGALSPWELRPL